MMGSGADKMAWHYTLHHVRLMANQGKRVVRYQAALHCNIRQSVNGFTVRAWNCLHFPPPQLPGKTRHCRTSDAQEGSRSYPLGHGVYTSKNKLGRFPWQFWKHFFSIYLRITPSLLFLIQKVILGKLKFIVVLASKTCPKKANCCNLRGENR